MKYKNFIDSILDENCTDIIYIEDENKQKIAYEQIALIPYDNKLYTIMVEKSAFDSMQEDVGEVFLVDEKKQQLKLVENVNIISSVFEIYDRMFDEIGE